MANKVIFFLKPEEKAANTINADTVLFCFFASGVAGK
jgi:hypothetical protein